MRSSNVALNHATVSQGISFTSWILCYNRLRILRILSWIEIYSPVFIIIIIIIYLSRSWAACWPVPVSPIHKSLQRSTMIPSASWGVVFHYPGQYISRHSICYIQLLLYKSNLSKICVILTPLQFVHLFCILYFIRYFIIHFKCVDTIIKSDFGLIITESVLKFCIFSLFAVFKFEVYNFTVIKFFCHWVSAAAAAAADDDDNNDDDNNNNNNIVIIITTRN